MPTISPAVSEGFCHPFPAFAVVKDLPELMVKVGGGNVATVPVGVYEGSEVTAPALLSVAGGQAYSSLTEAGI